MKDILDNITAWLWWQSVRLKSVFTPKAMPTSTSINVKKRISLFGYQIWIIKESK